MTEPMLQYQSQPVTGYLPLRGRAMIVYLVAGLFLLVSLGQLVSYYLQAQLLEGIMAGLRPTRAEAEMNDLRVRVLAISELALMVGLAVVFLMWKYRAYGNIRSFGTAHLNFTPKSAVGYYFAPFLNLYKPYQAMKEIYQHSTVGGDGSTSTALVGWWWAAWMIGNVVARVGSSLSSNAGKEGIEHLITGTWGLFWGTVGMLPGLVFMGILVHRITQMQELRVQVVPTDSTFSHETVNVNPYR